MTPGEVCRLAVGAGLVHERAVIATAVSWGESGLDPDAVGDEDLEDEEWGPSVGLWQVRSLRAHLGTGLERDARRLADPEFNARSMAAISGGGEDFSAWTIYRNGTYRDHLDAVRAAATNGGVPMKLVTRAEWGARSANLTALDVDMVSVHWEGPHMGTPAHSDCAGIVRGFQDFHIDGRGWSDIAYNAVACPHGYVFEGRGRGRRSAANGDAESNSASYAICFMGGEGDAFTDGARDAINDAAEWLVADPARRWGVHRDWVSTACPGDEITAWVRGGHPRPGAPTSQPPEGDLLMLSFRYIADGFDWVFDGPSRVFFHADDVSQITEVLDAIGMPALGQVSPATHRRYSELAAAAGFTG